MLSNGTLKRVRQRMWGECSDGDWGSHCKLGSNLPLCVAIKKSLTKSPPTATLSGDPSRGSSRGVSVWWTGRQKHVSRLYKGVALSEKMSRWQSYSLSEWAGMIRPMSMQHAASRVRVSHWGLSPETPHLQGPFSRPVAVANIVILCSPPQRPRKKSPFSHQRVTTSALGSDRVNRVLPSDLLLIPWSRRQNSQAVGIRHGC